MKNKFFTRNFVPVAQRLQVIERYEDDEYENKRENMQKKIPALEHAFFAVIWLVPAAASDQRHYE